MVIYCPKCFGQFSSNRDLERHLQRKIPCDQGDFKCPGCSQPFLSKQSLNTHLKKQRCKGKKPMLAAQELSQELDELKDRMDCHEHIMQMTNAATAAASSSVNINQNGPANNVNVTHQHITVNISNHSVSSLGEEKLTHLSRISDEDMLGKLKLTKTPSLMGGWCALLRADEEHPENHNALLLNADSKEMACCKAGNWSWGETSKMLLEILRADIIRLYTHLGRYDQLAEVQAFRNEYILHELMVKDNTGDKTHLQPMLDAIAEPIIALTRKFYAHQESVDMTPEQVAITAMLKQMQDKIALKRQRHKEQCAQYEQEEAEDIAVLLNLQRVLTSKFSLPELSQ